MLSPIRRLPSVSISQPWVRHAHQVLPLPEDHEPLDPETVSLIKCYPKHDNPTPYEILNLTKGTFNDKLLKSNFNKYAKIYHPDIKLDHPLLEDKPVRFHKILNAYKLLKDPQKRAIYDQYRIGWQSGETRRNAAYDKFRQSPNFKPYQYYSLATWEDFQHMKNGSPQETWDYQLNKYQILLSLVLFLVVIGVVEFLSVKQMSEQDTVMRSKISQRSKLDLQKLYENYGMGVDKDARINRFLWWRRISEILFNHS